MGRPRKTENHRSHRWSRFVLTPLVGLVAAATTSGCIIVSEDDDAPYYVEPQSPGQQITDSPALVEIDTGVAIPAEPGEGVGVFVEHLGDNTWRLFTTCDTSISGFSCGFYAVLTADNLRVREQQELEFDDIVQTSEDRVYLDVVTSYDFDGLIVETAPDAILRLELYLDGVSEPRFIYWVGNGLLHTGSPTNPVDFQLSSEPPPQVEGDQEADVETDTQVEEGSGV